jgi:hypothetical protein
VSTFWCFLHYTVAVGRVLILATRTRGERSVSACVNCMELEKHKKTVVAETTPVTAGLHHVHWFARCVVSRIVFRSSVIVAEAYSMSPASPCVMLIRST